MALDAAKESTKKNYIIYIERNTRSPILTVVIKQFKTVSVTSTQHINWEDRALTLNEIQALTSLLQDISIHNNPIAAKIDGTSYRLEIDINNNYQKYQWWGRLPAEWQSLAPIIERLKSLSYLSC